MRTNRFTKFTLGIVALMVSAISLRSFFQTETVRAATRQQWEYKEILRVRDFTQGEEHIYVGGTWKDYDDFTKPSDLEKKLAQLGQDGWELIAVEPISNVSTFSIEGQTSICPTPQTFACGATGASLSGFSMGGATTNERWVFKRPK
jgi:hypothetical protein